MTGRISGIKRMEIHDGDGIRTTIFFKGCPLRCIWCHNPESIAFHTEIAYFKDNCIACGRCNGERTEPASQNCPTNALRRYGQDYTVNDLVETVMQDAPFFKSSGGGVTLSGGECLAQPQFATALAKAFYERGISVYVDTCGFVSRDVLDRIIPYTDTFLYDIKAIDSAVHKQLTGQDNAPILDNLRYLCEQGCAVEVRYPLVVGYNDRECTNIAEFLSSLRGITKVKVLRYHNLSASRYAALDLPNTLPNALTGEADAVGAQLLADELCKFRQLHGLFQRTHAAQPLLAPDEGPRVDQLQRLGETVVDAALSGIQIGMHTDGGNAIQ